MKAKNSWFIKVWESAWPEIVGIGECGPLLGLSIDAVPEFEPILENVITMVPSSVKFDKLSSGKIPFVRHFIPSEFPSIIFGMETALMDLLNGGKRIIFNNGFVQGEPIPINGLIWMGDFDFMINQIDNKIAQGYRCIKLKVGGIDFDRECEILAYIRKKYPVEKITLRVDANGAFDVGDALDKLNVLAKFNLHSIEQPIRQGLPEMEELCIKSPVPIALDEELIGCETMASKKTLLSRLKPQFIVLKPSLHGGLSGCDSWITTAEEHNIAWWITSALESSIGLNAICQFTANYPVAIPQGLGTGAIYRNNFDSPLKVENGNIFVNKSANWSVDI
jgi:O-succinylbenzoate synthase